MLRRWARGTAAVVLSSALALVGMSVNAAAPSERAAALDSIGDTAAQASTIVVPPADVPPYFWAYREIMACIVAGVVQGFPDGLYHPELQVDRGTMTAYITRAVAGGEVNVPPTPAEASFADVPPEAWSARYVEYAVALDIVTGYPNGEFRPGVKVDREQMAVFIARAVVEPTGEDGLTTYTPPAMPTFSDLPAGSWCYEHVEYLAVARAVTGYPDGTYRPQEPVLRDQMAVYIARAFGFD